MTRHGILLLGNLSSIYVKGFIEHVIFSLKYDVYVYSVYSDEEKRYCDNNNIEILHKHRRLGFLTDEFLYLLHVKRKHKFDCLHIHYVDESSLKIANLMKNIYNSKIIATYWGSDVLQEYRTELEKRKEYISKVDYITADSLDVENKLKEVYHFYDFKSMNYKRVCFGTEIAEYIDIFRNTVSKEQYGLNKDDIVIAVGYNGLEEQQHKKVVSALSYVCEDVKKKIVILLQFSYAHQDEDYERQVIEACKKKGLRVLVFNEFMRADDVAKIRLISDIYINSRITDAFCSSIKEYFYSSTYVINAAWLRYPELNEMGLDYREFTDFGEIPGLIDVYLEDKKTYKFKNNIKNIRKQLSWDGCRQEWNNIYIKLLK